MTQYRCLNELSLFCFRPSVSMCVSDCPSIFCLGIKVTASNRVIQVCIALTSQNIGDSLLKLDSTGHTQMFVNSVVGTV